MTEPTTGPKTAGWVKLVLALSLGLNLAIIGIIGGAFLRDGPRDRGMPRDLSFGPFTEALTREDRRALRAAFLERGADFRADRDAAQAEFATLIQTLRADPFDPAAMQQALARIEARNAERLAIGRSLIERRIIELSAPQRLAFADRLEGALSRGGRP